MKKVGLNEVGWCDGWSWYSSLWK